MQKQFKYKNYIKTNLMHIGIKILYYLRNLKKKMVIVKYPMSMRKILNWGDGQVLKQYITEKET